MPFGSATKYPPLMPNPIGAPAHGPRTAIQHVEVGHMWYQIYRDANRQFRWRLIAGNNKRIANSGEGYHNREDCEHAISLAASSGDCYVFDGAGVRRR